MRYWNIEILEYWDIGILRYCKIDILEYLLQNRSSHTEKNVLHPVPEYWATEMLKLSENRDIALSLTKY